MDNCPGAANSGDGGDSLFRWGDTFDSSLLFKYGDRILKGNLHISLHFLEKKAGWREQPVETAPGTALG